VTNDDGVHSDGIRLLAETLAPFGDVTVVAAHSGGQRHRARADAAPAAAHRHRSPRTSTPSTARRPTASTSPSRTCSRASPS
jgi:broad specificity polyphosphatase/5'/3'-nucleotidase SurE